MKQLKLIGLLILILLFSSQIKAEDTTKVTPSIVYHDVKHELDVNAPKVANAIKSIALDLKVTADQVWNILVKQQKVWSWCFLLLTLSALTNWYFWYKNNFGKYILKKGEYEVTTKPLMVKNPKFEEYYENRSSCQDDIRSKRYIEEGEIPIINSLVIYHSEWFKYLHICICLTLSIFSYLHFAQMLTGFMNPEYGAMQTIAEVANHLK